MKNKFRTEGDITYILTRHLNAPPEEFTIDTDDLPRFQEFTGAWYIAVGYPRMNVKYGATRRTIHAHNLVLDRLFVNDGLETDHISSVRTDCRKQNLQAITHAANSGKVTLSDHTYGRTGFRNIYRRGTAVKYSVIISGFNLGSFELELAKVVAANYRALVNFQRCVLPSVY